MLTLLQKINHAKTRVAQRLVSQVTQDVRAVNLLTDPLSHKDIRTSNQGKYAWKLPDYDLSANDSAHNFESLALPQQHIVNSASRIHPLEEAAKLQRYKADVYTNLKPNQCVFTNLPQELEPWMRSQAKWSEYIVKNVHKDLEVLDVQFVNAVTTSSQAERLAYVIVTLGSKRQAHLVRSALRKTWFGDSLLKIRMQEDAKREAFDYRTVMIRDIPTHMTQRQLLDMFAADNGSVVSIELPYENVSLVEYIENKQSQDKSTDFFKEKQDQLKKAQLAVKRALNLDQANIDALTERLGPQVVNTLLADKQAGIELVNDERQKALVRIVTRLQAEGVQVKNHRFELQRLRSEHPHSSIQAAEQKQATEESLTKIMQYLQENEQSAPNVVNQPIEDLLKLSAGELAHAYDSLIQALDAREKLIEERLSHQLQHFGMDERVLLEGKNYNLELEDVPGLSRRSQQLPPVYPEHIISLQDQINYILLEKQISPEMKFSRLMSGILNPFEQKLFTQDQLLVADAGNLKKHAEVFDPIYQTKSIYRMFREGSQFTTASQKYIDDLITDLRQNFNIPFDELYHKEKALVQAVVEADRALKAKESALVEPLVHCSTSKQEADRVLQNSLLKNQHDNIVQQSLERQTAQLHKLEMNTDASQYQFQSSTQQRLQDMVQSGELSQSEYDAVIQMGREQEQRNLGYCFITFSHSDEARILLLKNPYPFIGDQKIQLDLKVNIDHSELDFDFHMQQMKNDSKVIDEIQQLREAKEKLREFELDYDNQFPNTHKLKNFRNLARNVINGTAKTEHGVPNTRTNPEEQKFREKVKELERKYPHVDLTQLFNSENADQARKALHKNAFASYKAYEFLKHGIVSEQPKTPKEVMSEAKQRMTELDPYNFPELDATVAKVLSKDVHMPTVLDHGEKINTPGRRFKGYTESEFIEAFYGKDLMRNSNVDRQQDPLFKEQISLKEKFPMSKFLKMPDVQKQLDGFKKMGLTPDYKSIDFDNMIVHSADPDIRLMTSRFDEKFNSGEMIVDQQHPYDPSRTLLNDVEDTIGRYEKARAARGQENTYDMAEVATLRRKIIDEYKPFEYVKYQKGLRKGEPFGPKVVKSKRAQPAVITDEKRDAKFEKMYDKVYDPSYLKTIKEYDPSVFDPAQYDQKKLAQVKKDFDKLWAEGGQERLDQEFKKYKKRKHTPPDTDKMEKQVLVELEQQRKQDEQDRANITDFAQDRLDVTTSRVNKEYLYNIAQKELDDRDFTKNFVKVVKDSEMTKQEALEALGTQAYLDQAGSQYGGKWFEQHDIGNSQTINTEASKGGKTLQSFVDNDEDVYEQYQRSLQDKPRQETDFKINQQDMAPEMPRYEEYLNDMQQGIHPFDKITDKLNEKLKENQVTGNSQLEKDQEQQLYQRELLGRLMGERLTPRQFEIITGQYSASDAKLSRVKNQQNEQFLSQRQFMDLAQEHAEKIRRQMVKAGEWTEQESAAKLQQFIAEKSKELPGSNFQKKITRDSQDILEAIRMMDNPDTLLEKEYYFDESLGESLDQHCQKIKQRYPGMQVLARRDRDGFAVVKTMFKPEYKYNLDEIENFDYKAAKQVRDEAIEAVLGAILPSDKQQCVDDITQSFEQIVAQIQSEPQKEVDSLTKIRIQELVQKRFANKIELPSMVDELFKVAEEAKFDKDMPSLTNTIFDEKLHQSAYQELVADRDRFRSEIYEQLMSRIRKHMYLTKRTELDYIKPRVSEAGLLEKQVISHERAIEGLEAEKEWFDKEAFLKIKEEIQSRKQAKQRLLNQGMPEFKAYLRF